MALRLATAFVEVRASKRLLTRDLLSARALVRKKLPGFIIPIRLNLPMLAKDISRAKGMVAGAGLAGFAGGRRGRVGRAFAASSPRKGVPLVGRRAFGTTRGAADVVFAGKTKAASRGSLFAASSTRRGVPLIGRRAEGTVRGATDVVFAGGGKAASRGRAFAASSPRKGVPLVGRRAEGTVRGAGDVVFAGGPVKKVGGGGGRFGALKVAGGVGAIVAILEGIHAVKTFARFEDVFASFRGIQRLKGVGDRELDEFSLFVRKLGKATPRTPGQIALAASELARGGLDLGTIRTVLPSIVGLSIAGRIDAEDAAGLAITTLRSLKVPVEEFSDALDQLAVTAVNSRLRLDNIGQALKFVGASATIAGVPRERLFSIIGILSNSGLLPGQTGRLGSQLLQQLVKPKVQAKFKGLGVDLIGDDGQLRRFSDIFKGFIAATKGKTDVERAGLIFGKNLEGEGLALNTRAGRAFAALLIDEISNPESLSAFEDKLKAARGALQVLVDEQMKTIVSIAKIVASAFEELEIAVIKPNAEALKDLLKSIAEFLKDITPGSVATAKALFIVAGRLGNPLPLLAGKAGLPGFLGKGGLIPDRAAEKRRLKNKTKQDEIDLIQQKRFIPIFKEQLKREEAIAKQPNIHPVVAPKPGGVVARQLADAFNLEPLIRSVIPGIRGGFPIATGKLNPIRRGLGFALGGLLPGIPGLGAIAGAPGGQRRGLPVPGVNAGPNIANTAMLAGRERRINARATLAAIESFGKLEGMSQRESDRKAREARALLGIKEEESGAGQLIGIKQLGRRIQESLVEGNELKKIDHNTKLTVKELEDLNKKFKAGIKVDFDPNAFGGFV